MKFKETAIKAIVKDIKEIIQYTIKRYKDYGYSLEDFNTYQRYIEEIYDGSYSSMKKDVEYTLYQLLNALPDNDDMHITVTDELEIVEDGEITTYRQLMKEVRDVVFKNGLYLDIEEE